MHRLFQGCRGVVMRYTPLSRRMGGLRSTFPIVLIASGWGIEIQKLLQISNKVSKRFAIYVSTDSTKKLYISTDSTQAVYVSTMFDRGKNFLTEFDRGKTFRPSSTKEFFRPRRSSAEKKQFDHRAFSTMDFRSNSDMCSTRLGQNINRKPRPE